MTADGSAHLLELLDIQWPIIQAPMAGTGTPALAAAVSSTPAPGLAGRRRHQRRGGKKDDRRVPGPLRAVSKRQRLLPSTGEARRQGGERVDRATAAGVRAIWRDPADTPDGDLSQLR